MVSAISNDLSHQETIVQIADTLDHLDRLTSTLFGGLRSKIEATSTRLNSIDRRVSLASKKVEVLASTKKATCLYSSAKYPSDPTSSEATLDLYDLPTFEATPFKYKWADSPVQLSASDVKEKLRFLHIKPKQPDPTLEEEDIFNMTKQPPCPTMMRSAASYLVFNTAENPYENKGRFVDPLEDAGKKKIATQDEADSNTSKLGEAPVSLVKADHDLDDIDLDNYFYTPAMGELPELDLPDILDLPNLPTDLSYATDLGPGIAPSSIFEAVVIQEAPPLIIVEPEIEVEEEKIVEVFQQQQPPQPPLEAPPPLPEEDLPDAGCEVQNDGGSRANLMAAIRGAGGSNGLKSVKERKAEKREDGKRATADNNNKIATSNSGGDLMADLSSKLALRRKGISGKQQEQQSSSSSGSTMDKISLMIPAPEAESNASEYEEEDDDDDDDDWS